MQQCRIVLLCLAAVACLGGIAVNHDGADDYVEVPDVASLDVSPDFTIAAWVKSGTLGGSFDPICAKWDDVGDNERAYLFTLNSSRQPFCYAVRYLTGSTPSTLITASAIQQNRWTHLVFVQNSATRGEVWIDGVLDATDTSPAVEVADSPQALEIGRSECGGASAQFFNGEIASVLLFNRALPQAEIERLYKTQHADINRWGLVGVWGYRNQGQSTGQTLINGATAMDRDNELGNNGTIYDGSDNSMTIGSSLVRERRGRR